MKTSSLDEKIGENRLNWLVWSGFGHTHKKKDISRIVIWENIHIKKERLHKLWL